MNADTGGGYHVDPAVVSSLPTGPDPDFPEIVGVRLPLDPPMPEGHPVTAGLQKPNTGTDAVVGAWWFTQHVWAFDHRAGQLQLLDGEHDPGDIPLAFARDADRAPASPYPRIQATIDSETIDLLLDTGATTTLTDGGLVMFGEPRHQAISFITDGIMRSWRDRHPDWMFVEGQSAAGYPMIKVPDVRVGPVDLGPVWFEGRRDHDFHDYMSQWMDRRIDGALGGNAFIGHRLVIDYSNAVAAID